MGSTNESFLMLLPIPQCAPSLTRKDHPKEEELSPWAIKASDPPAVLANKASSQSSSQSPLPELAQRTKLISHKVQPSDSNDVWSWPTWDRLEQPTKVKGCVPVGLNLFHFGIISSHLAKWEGDAGNMGSQALG